MDSKKATDRIVNLMREKGVTINDLSSITQIGIERLQRYIAGCFDRISVNETVCLAKYFDISPSYLMGWTDYRELEYILDNHTFTYKNMMYEDADKQFIKDMLDKELLSIEIKS